MISNVNTEGSAVSMGVVPKTAPVSPVTPDAWAVASSDPMTPPYVVRCIGGAYSCTCKGYQYRQSCRHIAAVVAARLHACANCGERTVPVEGDWCEACVAMGLACSEGACRYCGEAPEVYGLGMCVACHKGEVAEAAVLWPMLGPESDDRPAPASKELMASDTYKATWTSLCGVAPAMQDCF